MQITDWSTHFRLLYGNWKTTRRNIHLLTSSRTLLYSSLLFFYTLLSPDLLIKLDEFLYFSSVSSQTSLSSYSILVIPLSSFAACESLSERAHSSATYTDPLAILSPNIPLADIPRQAHILLWQTNRIMSFKGVSRIPLPTFDRPFIVELWPQFDLLYSRVMGHSPNTFIFVPGATPLSTFTATATMLTTYYVTVFAGREFMKTREPFRLNGFFMVHNLALTVISGILLALFIEQLVPTIARNGLFFAICDHRGGWTAPLVTLYYVRTSPSRSAVSRLIASSSIILLSTWSYWILSLWFSRKSPSVRQEDVKF